MSEYTEIKQPSLQQLKALIPARLNYLLGQLIVVFGDWLVTDEVSLVNKSEYICLEKYFLKV